MELARGTRKTSKVVLEDVINSMPDNVVTNILDRLPIQHAVRTAILSRKWRFKWTMLTHIVFDKMFYEYLVGLGFENWYKVKNIISRLLLHLKGPITRFVLYIPDKVFDVEDINSWIMFLSRKRVKELTLKNRHGTPLNLSIHIFSCAELENLTLRNCSLRIPPTFCGLPNLLCLELHRVAFENASLGKILIQSPLLEILKFGRRDRVGKIKLVEITKLKNLKQLYLPLCFLDHKAITSCLIVDLGSCLPNLQLLYLDFQNSQFLGNLVGRKRVSTSFPSLEILILHQIDFSSKIELLLASELICYSPKLQTLEISAKLNAAVPPPANFVCTPTNFSSELNDIQLGVAQLRKAVLPFFQGSENEMLLIKKLLAGSPSLKKIYIHPKSDEVFSDDKGKLMVATKLLKFYRASPTAEVEIYWS
ncbi:F-box/FBD/LRR-repeat protein At1g13570-like [Rutidosis leptorrhynchoides]|uniref:F-box/FBD/LRR-repeat protein At1g13570-like n=1 Tax=Rutidosis leptorrhynchoides TaxID=125765 RepID=UPI003A99D05C